MSKRCPRLSQRDWAHRLRGEVVDEDPLQIAIRERAGITSAATLPKPLDLGNFQVVKDPHMWILFFAKTKVARGHFRSEFGTLGVLLQAFDVALGVAFPGASLFERRTLCDIFMQVGMIFINHPAAQGVDDLFLTVGSCLNSAAISPCWMSVWLWNHWVCRLACFTKPLAWSWIHSTLRVLLITTLWWSNRFRSTYSMNLLGLCFSFINEWMTIIQWTC